MPTDLHPFQDLYDAAIRHSSVKIVCGCCRHSMVFNLAALWWHFNRNGWNDRFAHVRRRLFCLPCRDQRGVKVRPTLEFGDMPPTDIRLPMPSRADWAREARRRR